MILFEAHCHHPRMCHIGHSHKVEPPPDRSNMAGTSKVEGVVHGWIDSTLISSVASPEEREQGEAQEVVHERL